MSYQKQSLKQVIQAIKYPSTTKGTKMIRNYGMNSEKLKFQEKNQYQCGTFQDNINHTMLTQNLINSA